MRVLVTGSSGHLWDVLARLKANENVLSPLAYTIGIKGYHAKEFEEGPYPTE